MSSSPSLFAVLPPVVLLCWRAGLLLMQWWNFCWYIILGVSTALDTLGSQAVGGQQQQQQ
jgi:hypothetical protein